MAVRAEGVGERFLNLVFLSLGLVTLNTFNCHMPFISTSKRSYKGQFVFIDAVPAKTPSFVR